MDKFAEIGSNVFPTQTANPLLKGRPLEQQRSCLLKSGFLVGGTELQESMHQGGLVDLRLHQAHLASFCPTANDIYETVFRA